MGKLSKMGRTFFAIAMAAFGIQYLVHALFPVAPPLGPPGLRQICFQGISSR
jgi:hypothetical protein